MKRLVILFLAMLLLTACDTETDRRNAEAARLSAQATLTRAETDASTAKALVDAQNARADDLQLIVWVSAGLAGLSMAVSIAMAFTLHKIARSAPTATVVYQIMPPAAAQLADPDAWPEIRARNRALQATRQRQIVQ